MAGRETDIWYGTINTAVLMTSSLTMAVAAQAAEADMRRLTIWCLAATVAFGLMFLVLKGFEYAEDIEKNLCARRQFCAERTGGADLLCALLDHDGIHAIHLRSASAWSGA